MEEKMLFKWRQRIGYGLLESGRFLSDFLIQLYLMIYFTDVVKIPAVAVGTMFLVCKLVDAVTDYIAGMLVDRTHSRFGKSRPWSMLGTVLATVGIVLVFHSPEGFSTGGRLAWAYVTYSLWSLGMTFLNIPEFTILPALTADSRERTVLATCRQLFGNVINFGGTYVCASLLAIFATRGGEGYPTVAMIIAAVVFALECIGIFLCKEVNLKEEDKSQGEYVVQKDSPFRTSIKVFRNKKFWLFGFMAAFISFGFVTTLTSGIYFFKYTMGNPMLQASCMAALSGAQFIGMFLCPYLNKKYQKRTLVISGLILAEIGYGMLFLSGEVQSLAIAAYFVFGFGFSVAFTMYFALMPELFDYLEEEIGYSVAGIASSLTQYLVKVGNALCASAISFVLVLGKYDPSLEIQSAYTKNMIRGGITVLPGAVCLLGMLCVWFLDLEKKEDEVVEEV